MTTLTLKENLKLSKTTFENWNEMLVYLIENINYDFDIFEEYLNSKMLKSMSAPESDFYNL